MRKEDESTKKSRWQEIDALTVIIVTGITTPPNN